MVEAESNTATGQPVVLTHTVHQVRSHINESWTTSKCPSAVPRQSGVPSNLGSASPTSLRRFDRVPVGVNPSPERGERLSKGSAEICDLETFAVSIRPESRCRLIRPSRSERRSVSARTLWETTTAALRDEEK